MYENENEYRQDTVLRGLYVLCIVCGRQMSSLSQVAIFGGHTFRDLAGVLLGTVPINYVEIEWKHAPRTAPGTAPFWKLALTWLPISGAIKWHFFENWRVSCPGFA